MFSGVTDIFIKYLDLIDYAMTKPCRYYYTKHDYLHRKMSVKKLCTKTQIALTAACGCIRLSTRCKKNR